MVWRGVRLIAGLPMGRPILAGDRADAFAAAQGNLAGIVERHAGENQHPVGGVNIIAAVFTDGGDRLLPFNVRRLDVKAQSDAGRVTMET